MITTFLGETKHITKTTQLTQSGFTQLGEQITAGTAYSPYPKASGGMSYPAATVAATIGQFDAGARFNTCAPPSKLPPPPECALNIA